MIWRTEDDIFYQKTGKWPGIVPNLIVFYEYGTNSGLERVAVD